jgi:LysR family hydrogen peroxide-inducible transcriptional activator
METRALPFTLRQLQYAAAVAELRSFRKAAERCAVSQPALSAQLAALERGLGARLFERDRRRVFLTPAGSELLPRLLAVLLPAGDLVTEARRLVDPLSGTLRLGILPTIAPYLLPFAAPLLSEKYPDLTLLWTEEKTDPLLQALAAGELEGALVASAAEGEGLASETLGRDVFLLAAPRSHPLARPRGAVRFEELRGAAVLLLDDGHCLREQALAVCARANAHERGFRATSLATLSQMAAAGLGVTLLPRLAAATEAARATLVLRPFAEPAPHRTLTLLFRSRSPLAPSLRALAEALRRAFARAISARP